MLAPKKRRKKKRSSLLMCFGSVHLMLGIGWVTGGCSRVELHRILFLWMMDDALGPSPDVFLAGADES